MSDWEALKRQIEQEESDARVDETSQHRLRRAAERERVKGSSITEANEAILEFIDAAALQRYPRRLPRVQRIIRDPAAWQFWRGKQLLRDGITYTGGVYFVPVDSFDQGVRIAKDGTWEYEFTINTGEWSTPEPVYGRRANGYFMIEEWPYGVRDADVDKLRRALLRTMKDLEIPIPH